MAKDDNKEYQRNIKAFNSQVNKAEAKESEGRQLTNEQKKNKAELQKLLKTRTKLYDINESKDRQFQAQKMQEYSQFAEKDFNSWDPYDNTPSSKKVGVAALGYAAQAQTNSLLERILKSQDNNPFNASLLNLEQQQVNLLSVISENIKAMRGVMAPTKSANNRNELKDYEVGVSDTAKYLASLRFDKAAGSYMKAVGNKLDSTGEIGLALMALGQFKELAKDGGIYKIIKEGITGAIKTTILGTKNAREWDRMKEDPATYIQEVINKAAGSKNAGIRALAEPLYKTNKIDLQRKMNKTDWSAGAKFDNKFYKSVIGSFETLREILGAIKGTKTTQFDWESETYRTESEIYLRQIAKNEDKLKNVRRNMKNELASIMQEMGNDPAYASFARNNLAFDQYGNVRKDARGNAQWTSDKIIKYVEKYIQSTGGRFDNMGDDLRNIIKSMGIDITDPKQVGIARQAMEILGMLRNYYRTASYAMKERMNDLSSGYRDIHGRNTYNQIDNRIGASAIQTLQAFYDMHYNDPKVIRQMMNNVDLSVSLPRGGGFGGGGSNNYGTMNSSVMGYNNSFSGYNNAKTFINQLNSGRSLKQQYKVNKEAAKLLQGEWIESPMNVAKEFNLTNLSLKDKASELKNAGRLGNRDYDLIMGNVNGSAVDTDNAKKLVEREHKRYEVCVRLFEVIHRAGASAQAYAAKHGGSVTKYKSQGYISSPSDLMDCVDDTGKINQAKMAKLGWGFVSDTYIANEARKQREEDDKYRMDGNIVQNTNKLLSSVWQDASIQKKLRIGGGTAVGLAIGSMLKNKGIISSNLGVYTMGAIGAGVMMTERAKKAIDMMYGPDSETKGPNGFSNREIGMAKLAQKVIPAAAGVAAAGKTFMFSQRIFNSMGPVAGMVGFIPSLGAALAAGGITYKMLPMLRDKIRNAESGKGILGKLKDKLKSNKTLANIFGLTGERSNAAIYADNIDPIIKELEVNIAKLRQENPYSVEASLKEDNLRALKDYQYRLKSIDKDHRMSMEDKNSQASLIYDGIINLIKDQQRDLFMKRTAADRETRDKAAAGFNAADQQMTDFEAIRAQNNIDQYNTARNVQLSQLKTSFKSTAQYAKEGEARFANNYKTSYENVVKARDTFANFRGNDAAKFRSEAIKGREDEYINSIKDKIKTNNDREAYAMQLKASGLIKNKKFKSNKDLFAWMDKNKNAIIKKDVENNNNHMKDFLTMQMDAQFGSELAEIFRKDQVGYANIFNEFSNMVNAHNASDSNNVGNLAESARKAEYNEYIEEAKRLGITDSKEQEIYATSKYVERNLNDSSIRLNPKILQGAMKDNRIFDWMNGISDSTGIKDVDKFLDELQFIDSFNTNVKNSPRFRQMFGGWLIRQAYMAGLHNSGKLDAKNYNELFENILKEYVEQVNNYKNATYSERLEKLTNGNTSLTDEYSLDDLVKNIQYVYKTESDPARRNGIVNSMLVDRYASKELNGKDFGDIIGGQFVASEEFNKLVALRKAIIKNPDGSDIPDDVHKSYIMDRINKFNANGFFGRLMNKFGIKVMRKLNGLDEEDIANEKVADKVLIHALTNMYNTSNLADSPYFKKSSTTGADGVTQNTWVADGTIGSKAPEFPTMEELRQNVLGKFNFNMDRYAFGSGAGYGNDTANANMYASKNNTLKMSDLSGYSFNNGAKLDSFGCSIAAVNNALVILKIPTLSKETMINIANQYLDKYGIKYGFFTHIANMLGIKSEIMMANGNTFNKTFFNKLKFTNATYIALLDNIGHDSGAHYVNILSVSGDNVSINDPMQNGLTDLSISEITARASLIIKLDSSSSTSTVNSFNTSAQSRIFNESGSGFVANAINGALMFGVKQYNKHSSNNSSSNSSNKGFEEGLYDPQVALIATNVSDEKQKQGLLAFIASSKNKAFAAAANRFRSLLSKPELRTELKEKQDVADTQEQQGKDISAMKDAILNGAMGGAGALTAEQIAALSNNGGKGGGGLLSNLLSLSFKATGFGGLLKVGKSVKNKFAKLFGKEAAKETAESGAEAATKKIAGEVTESAFETGGREIVEDVAEKSISTTAKVVNKADDVAEITSKGGKFIKVLNKADDFIKHMTDKVWQVLNYVVVKLPVKIAKKLADSSVFKWVCRICGKNSDTLISRAIAGITKMTKKLVSKVSNSMIGNAIKKCAKKAVATIGLIIDVGQFLWSWYKGTKNASKYLDMEREGFTQNWLESKDLNDNVGLHYAWYDSGLSLITSLIATGVEWGSLGTATATGISFAVQVVGFIFEQIWHAFRSFTDYFKTTDLITEMKDLLSGDKERRTKVDNSENKIESEIKKDIDSDKGGAPTTNANNVTATKAGNSNTYDKGGELPSSTSSNRSSSSGSGSPSGGQYTSITSSTRDFAKKFVVKSRTMVMDAFKDSMGTTPDTSGIRMQSATFDWSKIPTLDELKGAKFSGDPTANRNAIKFMSMVLPIAYEMNQKHGIYVDPYLAMTQWALESNWGRKPTGNYNFWGIKGWGKPTEYWDGSVADVNTHEVINGQSVGMSQAFRAYKSPTDAIKDYFLFMSTNFPRIKDMGIAGLNYGTNGKYATGVGYLKQVETIYNQFDDGMKKSGFDMAKFQASVANTANVPFINMGTGTGNLGNLVFSGGKWSAPNIAGRSGYKWASPLNNLAGTEIASVFGDRSDVAAEYARRGLKMSRFHRGVDFAQGSGSPFFAIADGQVVQAGGGSVNNIKVKHDNGIVSEYMHGYPVVKIGQRVTAGQQIGKVGKVGTGGAHLHLGMYNSKGEYLDPFFELGLDPKNVRTRNSPENIRFLKDHNFNTKQENATTAQAGRKLDSSGNMTKGDKGGDTSGGLVKFDNGDLVKELRDVKTLIGALINAVVSGLNNYSGVSELLGGILNAVKSKEKEDILSQISTARFN